MVMIPTDAGIQLRMQTEAALQPVAPVAEIPADVAALRPGQAFTAQIQEVLPENTYKALVAGHTVTLALPEGAKAGDTLELVVIDRTPRVVVAQLAGRSADAGGGTGLPGATLSPTAQLISTLLSRDGAPQAPVLTGRQPLVATPSADAAALAAELAPRLERAVSQSGLFYEAHQVQWMLGRRALSDLQAEPQARHAASAAVAGGTEAGRSLAREARGESPGTLATLQSLLGAEEARRPEQTVQQAAVPAATIPEELRPVVQQQLDAAATQRLAWHGEVWPGQAMDWRIEPDRGGSGHGQGEAESGWTSSLNMVTPRLGAIDARIHVTPQGARITLTTPVGATAADLLDAAPALKDAMDAAGVPLVGFQVRHELGEGG